MGFSLRINPFSWINIINWETNKTKLNNNILAGWSKYWKIPHFTYASKWIYSNPHSTTKYIPNIITVETLQKRSSNGINHLLSFRLSNFGKNWRFLQDVLNTFFNEWRKKSTYKKMHAHFVCEHAKIRKIKEPQQNRQQQQKNWKTKKKNQWNAFAHKPEIVNSLERM